MKSDPQNMNNSSAGGRIDANLDLLRLQSSDCRLQTSSPPTRLRRFTMASAPCLTFVLLSVVSDVFSQTLTESGSVVKQPGESHKLTCTYAGISDGDADISWIRQAEEKGLQWVAHISAPSGSVKYYSTSVKNRFSVSRDNDVDQVYLQMNSLGTEDSAVYYCARVVSYAYFDYWGKGTTVTVTSASQSRPTVFPLVSCGSGTGDMVTLACLATGFTPSALTFTWNKGQTALTDSLQYPPVLKNNLYTKISQIHVRRQDWDSKQEFNCVAEHAAGDTEAKVVKQEVPCEPPALKVLVSSDEESKTSFACFAKDFSPEVYEIKWLRNEEEITSKLYEYKTSSDGRKTENGTTLYSAASFLTIQSSDWTPDTKLTCEFKSKGEDCDATARSDITHKCTADPSREGCRVADVDIEISAPSMEDMFLNRKGTVVCQVQINVPSVDKIWWEDELGNEMAGASKNPPVGKTGKVRLPLDITYEEWSSGITRICVVQHSDMLDQLKGRYQRKIEKPAQRPSVYMLPPVEHTRQKMVALTCYVKDFFPREVLVSWLVDDEPADAAHNFTTTNPVETEGSYSVYSRLSLSLEQWKQTDVVYSCVVYHQSVVSTPKAIVRSIGYRTFEQTNLVNLNMNVPDTCKAQ